MTTTHDLTTASPAEQAAILRRSVAEWNAAVRAALEDRPGWCANLYRADLYGANISGAYLYGAYLSGADLARACLSGAYLSGANLYGAYLSGANLSGANISGAYLSGAYLAGANLYRADLAGANLSRADLSGANLCGATIDTHTLTGRHAWIGEAAGYPVLLLATDAGHVLRAGCWAGVLDDAVERAVEESDSDLVRAEAEAVVAHGRALLAAWKDQV
jgi:hypothetical protein